MRERSGLRRLLLSGLLAAGAAGVPATAGAVLGQQAAVDEGRLLQEAAAREGAGELAGAESLLRRVVQSRPTSAPALLALERVLRIQGRLETLPPLVRTALDEEPASALLNQLLLRTLAALDRPHELDAAARAWIDTSPTVEIPYREAAAVWTDEGRPDRARAVLAEGRERIGRPDALALELGDVYAALGDPERALREWDRAIGPEARGLLQVRRRLRALPDGGASLLADLAERLAAEPRTDARLEAAVELAVDAGLEDRARELAAELLATGAPESRSRYLSHLARRADAARQHRLAYWSYRQLLDVEDRLRAAGRGDRPARSPRSGPPGDVQEVGRRVAIQERLAELALELGDTTAAGAGLEAVEAALQPGTPEQRQAAAHRIELAAAGDPDRAAAALRAFRSDHPDAPELDRLTAGVAAAVAEGGRRSEAERLLAGVRGPRSSLLRARLALERGDVSAARSAFLAAAPELEGSEATAVLGTITLLGRLSNEAGAALGDALALQDAGRAGEAVDRLVAAADRVAAGDRPALLERAAEMAAEAGLHEDARAVLRRIVADHPHSTEAPAALLALARSLRSEEGSQAEARELLERLIVEYPRSALAPQARRELDTLAERGVAGTEKSSR